VLERLITDPGQRVSICRARQHPQLSSSPTRRLPLRSRLDEKATAGVHRHILTERREWRELALPTAA
jgi:hypothetical protein